MQQTRKEIVLMSRVTSSTPPTLSRTEIMSLSHCKSPNSLYAQEQLAATHTTHALDTPNPGMAHLMSMTKF
jgi:hypothetical protein